jgi:hypothetical protein
VINQFLRLGFLVVTGRFFKPRIRGLMLLAVVWVVLWFVHSEYVSYVELSNDRSFVLYASLAKLVLYSLSVGCYVLLVERPLWPQPVKAPLPVTSPAATPAAATAPKASDDGFGFLRHGEPLKSPAETPSLKPAKAPSATSAPLTAAPPAPRVLAEGDDGFDFLRRKDQLKYPIKTVDSINALTQEAPK